MDITNRRSAMKLIEEATGQVLDVDIREGDKVRIIRQETIEAIHAQETVPLNKGKRFVKQFPDVAEKICAVLSPNEVWLLNALIPYVGTNSGILRHHNGKFLTRQQIVGLCEGRLSRPTVDRTICDMVSHGVLAKCYVRDVKAYIMNPYICQNGSRANATLLSLFKGGWWS